MTRNGLVEENLATKETRKVTNSDQELPYKQKDVEQAFITSEKKKNSHKKAEKKQFSEKIQREILPKEEAANSPPGKRKHRDGTDTGTSLQVYLWIQRQKYVSAKKTQEPVSATEKETAETAVWKTGDSWKSEERKTSAETDGGHFQAEKNDVSTNRKKESRNIAKKQ